MMLSQDLKQSFDVRASLDEVWSFFWDIQALAKCLSGCESVVTESEGKRYRASIRRKVAVFNIGFELNVSVVEAQPPAFINLEISGHDKRLKSDIDQKLTARLQALDAQTTRIEISTTITISGLLASLGKNLVSMQFAQTLDDFAASVGRAIESRSSGSVGSGAETSKAGA
jgi:carbon monoxide dehydrogenase subunit G